MGTKVQCKSYSPVFYSMRDPNEDAQSGSWPLYFDDKSLKSEQYYNCFMTRSRMDGYSDYDKEILKHTMLEHETVFRKQVYELHRLYRTQRDLMNEFRRNELQKYQRPVEGSQPASPFSSQTASKDAKKLWQVPSFPLVRPKYPLNFIKESSVQATPNALESGGIFKERESFESKSKQIPRRMFDLQLPADEYVDSEGEQNAEENVSLSSSVAGYPLKRNYGVASGIDIKLSLGSSVNLISQVDASMPDSRESSRLGLADLNQPVQVEEAKSTASVDFLGTAALCGGSKRRESPAKLSYPGFPGEFVQRTQKDKTFSFYMNDLRSDSEGKRERTYDLEAGPRRGNFDTFRLEKLHAQSALPKVDFKRAHEYPVFSVSDFNKRDQWRERAVRGIEVPESSQTHSKYNYLASSPEPCEPISYPFVPLSEKNSESSSVSSWIKPMNNFREQSTEGKALPCLKSPSSFSNSFKPSSQNPVVIGNEWHSNSNLRSNLSCRREMSCSNGFCHGSQSESNASKVPFPSIRFDFLNGSVNNNNSALEHSDNHNPTKYFRGVECGDVKSAKDMNLNLALPNVFRDGEVRECDLVTTDGEGKNGYPPLGLPWASANLTCEDGPAKGKGHPSETGLGSNSSSLQVTSKTVETANVCTPTIFQSSNSASYASGIQSIKVGNCQGSKKILGIPIFDKSQVSKDQISLNSLSNFPYPTKVQDIQNSGKVVCSIDLSCQPAKPELSSKMSPENLKGLDINRSGSRNDFNLNLCMDEEENLSTPYIPKSTRRNAIEIDLEAPVVPESWEVILPDGDGDFSEKQLGTHEQSSSTRKEPLEELERTASEAIVFMSSSSNNLESSALKSSEESLKDYLNWFADVVYMNMADLESESRNHDESSCESDYFESMTLKLTETKLDELSCQIWVPENQKEEETGNCALLTRRGRGQSRRGRQRRDFQRDILPGLASLSRHEVTEDLQTFGGLMRATGHPWQSGVTRRNATRNGWARGRKRAQGPAPPTVICSPPNEQPNNIEVAGFDQRSLKGWGKTTRRPRRQRVPAGTLPLTHKV